jgi:hypothetical protein
MNKLTDLDMWIHFPFLLEIKEILLLCTAQELGQILLLCTAQELGQILLLCTAQELGQIFTTVYSPRTGADSDIRFDCKTIKY